MIIDEQDTKGMPGSVRTFRGGLSSPLLARGGSLDRERKARAAIVAFTLGHEGAAMHLRERFCNCQSEPEPAETPLKRAVTLLETIENTFHHFRFDPDPSVDDTNSQTLRRLIRGRNRDRANRR